MAPQVVNRILTGNVGDAMMSEEYWDEFHVELEPGTLYYRIERDNKLLETDLVRSDFSSDKWFTIGDRYTACVGYSIRELEEKHGQCLFAEVLREYLS